MTEKDRGRGRDREAKTKTKTEKATERKSNDDGGGKRLGNRNCSMRAISIFEALNFRTSKVELDHYLESVC